MKITYDSNKNQKNIIERNLSFDEALNLEWETALFEEDTRKQYPEKRFVAAALLNSRLHIICFAPIDDGIRIISFRKANKREVKRYEETKTINK